MFSFHFMEGKIEAHICQEIWLMPHFSSVQSFSHVRLFVIPWTAACQPSLSITNSRSLLKLMSIESVMSSNHLTLCHPLLLLPSIFPRIRVFSNESVLRIRWPKYWSFSFSISPSDEYSGLISFRMNWFDLLAVQGALKSLLQHDRCYLGGFLYQTLKSLINTGIIVIIICIVIHVRASPGERRERE